MKTAFRNLAPNPARVPVRFNGQDLLLPDGVNLAAALLLAGIAVFRHTPVSDAPRGPFCMMGACFECSVVIDGITRQACLLKVTKDMEITSHERPEHGSS
jgi:D-hydroxyproline dehydrogenase subunit gamma